MVNSVFTMSDFDDLPIAKTLAKMSLESKREVDTPETTTEESVREDHKEENPANHIVFTKTLKRAQVGGVPGRSILKPAEPSSNTTIASTTRSGGMEKRREVSFHAIHIRHHEMILGDNPACSIGPPIELAWEYQNEEKHDLDIYEVERRPRRKLRHLVLSYYRRKDILLQAGYSENDMKSVERQIGKLKRQRKTTGFFLPIQKMEEVVQSAGRKVRRVAGGKKKEEH